MLAVDLAHEERLIAIMDIGTNTELIVGNKHGILAASCPAGPAFEGGAIACGMPALDGAIEEVAIADDGSFRLGVIGDVPPEGICGSGLVDVLSELLRTGRMNDMGRFEDDVSRVTLNHAPGRSEDGTFICWRATSTSWRRPRAPTSRACTSSFRATASTSTTSTFFIWREGSGGTSTWKRRSASGWCRASIRQRSCRPAIRRLKARPSLCCR